MPCNNLAQNAATYWGNWGNLYGHFVLGWTGSAARSNVTAGPNTTRSSSTQYSPVSQAPLCSTLLPSALPGGEPPPPPHDSAASTPASRRGWTLLLPHAVRSRIQPRTLSLRAGKEALISVWSDGLSILPSTDKAVPLHSSLKICSYLSPLLSS